MIHRSPYPDPRIPDVPLHRYVLAHAARYGGKPALVDAERGTMLSYAELAAAVTMAADRLRAFGLRAGEAIALVGPNQPEWAVAFFGALEAQALVHPINPALTKEEIARQLRQVNARLVIAAEDVLAKASEAAATRHVRALSTWTAMPQKRATAAPGAGDAVPPPSLPAVLASSSGTTGLPKAVVLRHRNVVANLEQHRPVHRVTDGDVVSAVLPFFHIYGLTLVLSSALRHGATVITLSRFDLRRLLSSIERHRITRLYLVPPIVAALASAPEIDAYDLSSLRVATCGAAPLDIAAARRASARIGCPIIQGYGMTEASPGTHYTPEDRIATVPTTSVGYLLPGTEARIVATADMGDPAHPVRDADPERGGELWVRGPQIMQGYLDDPAATAECLTEDGWLRTGDIVRRDATGAFFVLDRLKELIKYKGHQVAPAELEALLRSHPDIQDAAVVGLAAPTVGEIPAAYVVSDPSVDAQALMTWVAARVAPYKKIRAVAPIARIPRSPAGKILRRVLRARARCDSFAFLES